MEEPTPPTISEAGMSEYTIRHEIDDEATSRTADDPQDVLFGLSCRSRVLILPIRCYGAASSIQEDIACTLRIHAILKGRSIVTFTGN
jgi:hypothetical protein